MTIYAEYLFLENFLIGYLLLQLTGQLTGASTRIGRILLGAVLCGCYSFTIFLAGSGMLMSLISKLAFSSILIQLVFRPGIRNMANWKKFGKSLLIFYVVTFVFGGATMAILYLWNVRSVSGNAVIYIEEVRYLHIAVGCGLGYEVLRVFIKLVKDKLKKERSIVKITINVDQKNVAVNALVDTANFLHDPTTGKPVCIIERTAILPILPEDCANRIHMIPFRSLGNKNGLIMGVRPDQVIVTEATGRTYPISVIMGLYEGHFHDSSESERYEALMNPEALITENS